MTDEKKHLGTTKSDFLHALDIGGKQPLQGFVLNFFTGEELATNVAPISKALNKLSAKNPDYYLKVPGERGAALCRDALKEHPNDIKAQSRLAFLLAMGETAFKEGDPKEPVKVLEQNWQNHQDSDSGYYRAKIELESYAPKINLAKNIFIELLHHNPEHLGALCGIANLTVRDIADFQNETDFLFPDSISGSYSYQAQ